MAGFTIPNTPDAYNQNQAEPDSLDFQILGNHGNAVVSGCEVTPGPSGATVAVSAGEVIVNGVHYPVSASVSLSLTAYASSPFFDIVVGRLASGTVSLVVLPGTSGANPVYPTITSNDVVLAAVWRPANTTPTTAMIVDKRLLVPTTTNRVSSGVPSSGTGANGETHVNSSWTADATLAGPLSVKVGGTWYQVARYSSNFTAGTVTATSFVGALTGNASTATLATTATLANTATLATKASTLSQGGGNGTAMTFNWSGQSGQPTWLWGSNDGISHNVYNPSNFSVNIATYSYGVRQPGTSTDLITYQSPYPSTLPVYDYVSIHNDMHPSVDNAYNLGTSGYLLDKGWGNVAAYNYQTISDQRKKTDITTSDLGLSFINKLNPVKYKWIIGSRVVENDQVTNEIPGSRPHYGFIAQEVKQVMDDLELADFGGWALSDKNDPDSAQSLRLMEFIAPMVKAIQELSARLDALEAQ
jgi:hypothetical protein